MFKRSLIAVTGAALLAGCGSQSGSDAASEAPKHVAAHDIKQLMATIVDPQAQVFWHSSGWVMDEKGEHDLTPTTDEGWLAARSAAATVTEMGNVLMTPQYSAGRKKDWTEFAEGLAKIGVLAEKAAADRNSDAVFKVGGNMYNVCKGCHEVYLPLVAAEAAAAKAAPDAAKPAE